MVIRIERFAICRSDMHANACCALPRVAHVDDRQFIPGCFPKKRFMSETSGEKNLNFRLIRYKILSY
jgi:hypothetical protein